MQKIILSKQVIDMKFKLEITPAFEVSGKFISFEFETAKEMLAAKNTCADLLLYMQDKLKIMPDYSNSFDMCECSEDGEWYDYEEDEDFIKTTGE
jgi:hypothetical protein